MFVAFLGVADVFCNVLLTTVVVVVFEWCLCCLFVVFCVLCFVCCVLLFLLWLLFL